MKQILTTKRLILREMTMDDLPAMREIVQDKQTMYAWGHAWSEEDTVAGLEKQLCAYREDGYGRWAVQLKETGAAIGMCGLLWWETDREKVPEIGYLFNRAYWHKGYATEAAIACREYAFTVLNADSVCSMIRDTHIASQNVAVRNGMKIIDKTTKNFRNTEMEFFLYSVDQAK